MNRYTMEVRRQVIETMRFTVEAHSAIHAHHIAEADVRAGKHHGQSREEIVSVQKCHPVQETDRQIDRQSDREDGAG